MDKYFQDGPGPRLLQTSDQVDFIRDEETESPGIIWLGEKQQQLQPVPPAYTGFTHLRIFLESVCPAQPGTGRTEQWTVVHCTPKPDILKLQGFEE